MSVTIADAVFASGVIATLALLACVVVSIVWPERRYWPPAERNWKYWSHWTIDAVSKLSLPALAWLDRGTSVLPRPTSLVLGGLLTLVGVAVAVAVERDLGQAESMGLEGTLTTDGLYRYSRNPQYVGLIAATVGIPLLANSRLALGLGAVILVHWLVLPLAEEPWLADRYGEAYERYRASVPRFVGPTTLSRLWADVIGQD
ncbi:methyltransferase family protein [Halorientalis halophila]|uniref:methyltransferase family protein n=1 Tax=Halorientalis halophila TaxID=3108499 RepID=UPI0030084D44